MYSRRTAFPPYPALVLQHELTAMKYVVFALNRTSTAEPTWVSSLHVTAVRLVVVPVTACSWLGVWIDRSVFFGRYWGSSPFVLSLLPRC